VNEPDDFGLSPRATLAHVADTTPAPGHSAFWQGWREEVFALQPRLAPAAPDRPDPGATHEFESVRHERVFARLVEPDDSACVRAGLVVLHGLRRPPPLIDDEARWKPVADRGVAVLLPRLRGWPAPGSPPADPEWIASGLEVPLEHPGRGCAWVMSAILADALSAIRALQDDLARRFPRAEVPMFVFGESLGGGLGVMVAAQLAERAPLSRLVIGSPSLGDWTWRLANPGAGRGRVIERCALRSDAAACVRLFDAAVHARHVECPVLCRLALRDDVVPAPAAAGVFNALAAPPGLKWRVVTKYDHFDGGITDARRHAVFRRDADRFLDPALDIPGFAPGSGAPAYA
jgi:cephalosporin-C deacetylase-like acetyl esterase